MPPFRDLDGKELKEGDFVDCLRYGLGKCQVVKEGDTYAYESLENGERVSWVKMVDAASRNQKVRKIR